MTVAGFGSLDTGLDRKYLVRHTKPHDDLDHDYHEWVEQSHPVVQDRRDRLGRKGSNGWHIWRRWRCNNLDCTAEAWVNQTLIESTVADWLSETEK